MSDRTKRVKTQWNSYVRPFDSFSDEEINGLLDFCSKTTMVAEELSGKKCFLAYGALLGMERSGKLIPHDFDIDVAIDCGRATKDEVAELCRDLIVKFMDAGYEVKAKCFAQFFVLPPKESKQRFKVEFFASWIEDEQFYLYFALPGIDIVDQLFPLKQVELQGHKFYAPKVPAALLASTYGDDWETPNSDFKYDMSGGRWAPFTSYFFSRNKSQWNEHYADGNTAQRYDTVSKSNLDTLIGLSTVDKQSVLDIGCGVGKDAIEIASLGHSVTAIDTSDAAIEVLKDQIELKSIDNVTCDIVNLYDVPECHEFAVKHERKFDIILARNLINSISLVGQTTLLKLVAETLTLNGEFLAIVPVDSVVDNANEVSEFEPNKRNKIPFYSRIILIEDFKIAASKFGLSLESQDCVNTSSEIHLRLSMQCNINALLTTNAVSNVA